MALIRPGRTSQRRLSLTGTVVLRVWRGRTYAQKWPRPRGLPAQDYQRAGLNMMTGIQELVKHLPGTSVNPMRDGLQRFLRRHRGVEGTAAIRLRDWLTQAAYGRAWMIYFSDGTEWWPETAARDVSDWLDWTEPRLGCLLTRTEEGWLPTIQCRPGCILTCATSAPDPLCCPPASIPDKAHAMGGVD